MQALAVQEKPMRTLFVIFALLFCSLASASDSCLNAHKAWRSDFHVFMSLMDCASAELAAAQDRASYLSQLSDALAGEVEWVGTVRAVRDERLYFNESFALIEPGMKAARVMYYSTPADAEEWQDVSIGQQVKYTGKIAATKVDTLASSRPLLYIELVEVRPSNG